MGELRAALQESWARSVLAASSVEEQAQELAGRITQSFQEGPLSPENAQKLLLEVESNIGNSKDFRKLVSDLYGNPEAFAKLKEELKAFEGFKLPSGGEKK